MDFFTTFFYRSNSAPVAIEFRLKGSIVPLSGDSSERLTDLG